MDVSGYQRTLDAVQTRDASRQPTSPRVTAPPGQDRLKTKLRKKAQVQCRDVKQNKWQIANMMTNILTDDVMRPLRCL